jgi:hypothetical protein
MKLKKMLAFLLMLAMCLTFASCQKKSDEDTGKENPEKQEQKADKNEDEDTGKENPEKQEKNEDEEAKDALAAYTMKNGKKAYLSLAEYSYYYMSLYNQAASVSQQYDSQYGQGAGAMYYFDTTVDPAEQEYTGDDASEQIKTWADFFRYSAPERAFLIEELYAASQADKNYKLTKEELTEINNNIRAIMKQLKNTADILNYSLDEYIEKTYCEGLNAKKYEELLRRDIIAEEYLSWYQTKLANDVSDTEIEKYYNEHKDDFDLLTIRFFKVSYAENNSSSDPVYTKEQAKKRAEKFKSKVTTEKEFIEAAKEFAPPSLANEYKNESATLDKAVTKTAAKQLSDDFVTWAFDTSRKSNDIKVFDFADMEAYCIVLLVETAHKDTSVTSADVRHLLVQVDTSTTDKDGATVTLKDEDIKKNWADAKVEAEKLLKEWKDNGATEDEFVRLVKEHTDDTASAETGGLYVDINATSNYVPEFLEWSLTPHKSGDTGIIKTDYGYHIMYYVGGDNMGKWESDIRNALSESAYNDYFDTLYENVSNSIKRNDNLIDEAVENLENQISSLINSTN